MWINKQLDFPMEWRCLTMEYLHSISMKKTKKEKIKGKQTTKKMINKEIEKVQNDAYGTCFHRQQTISGHAHRRRPRPRTTSLVYNKSRYFGFKSAVSANSLLLLPHPFPRLMADFTGITFN